MPPIFFALCANASFATASILFVEYTKKTSASWLNFYKAAVATLSFFVVCSLFQLFVPLPGKTWSLLLVSGLSGLMIGDIFLLRAFAQLGSARTLMVFGFQPILLGLASSYLFGQAFEPLRLIAVIFLVLCVLSFSLESFKLKGHWDAQGIAYALIGVLLDSAGILMTRTAFDNSPELSPFYANFIRAGVACFGFIAMSLVPAFKLQLLRPLMMLPKKDRYWVTLASFFGTFMSLGFYLMAVQKGHLASISAVAGTTPLFATLMETIFGKRKFNIYLGAGLTFFVIGFSILTLVSFD